MTTEEEQLKFQEYLRQKYGHKTTLAVRRSKLAAACRSAYEWSLGLSRRKTLARYYGPV